jgi:hypothetical protein
LPLLLLIHSIEHLATCTQQSDQRQLLASWELELETPSGNHRRPSALLTSRVGENIPTKLQMFEGDDPKQVVEAFCRKVSFLTLSRPCCIRLTLCWLHFTLQLH